MERKLPRNIDSVSTISSLLICNCNQEEVKHAKNSKPLLANPLQIAVLNKMLPAGFKLDSVENVKKQIEA